MAPFLRESLNKIYLDTGCVKTVSGKTWVDNTLKGMSDDVKKLVRFYPSTAHIKFGERTAQKSHGTLIVKTPTQPRPPQSQTLRVPYPVDIKYELRFTF